MATGTIPPLRSDTGWVNITNDGKVKYRIKDSVVYLTIDGLNMSGTQETIQLPAAIKPATNINPFCRAQTDILQCWINSSSNALIIQGGSSARSAVAAFAVYPV